VWTVTEPEPLQFVEIGPCQFVAKTHL
jgi:hypothetical protein